MGGSDRHKIRIKLWTIGILIGASFGINGLYGWSAGFRHWYENTWYPAFSSLQRIVTGWCPFSIGDILYLLAGVWILFYLIRLFKALRRFHTNRWIIADLLLGGVIALLGLYLCFLVFWGLNYRSFRTVREFRITPQEYSTGQLIELSSWLLDQTNRYHRVLDKGVSDSTVILLTPLQIFSGARACYAQAETGDRRLSYRHPSVKPSMFGYLMNYLGVSGYYNPFTGEAQVNTTIPEILQPFVCCHEMAHQLGFAPEESANFVGFVAAIQSPDTLYRYSADFDILLYALGELRFRDSATAKALWQSMDTGIKKDYRTILLFDRQFNNPIDPLISRMYDRYLRANHEREGIRSYDEVIGLLIQYYRRLPH